MTRCPNCGAERQGHVCEHCGLSAAAAGYAMRRRLINRLGIFLLGSIGFFVPCFLYPPLELDKMLIFLGAVFFAAIALAVVAERRAIRFEEVEVLKRIFFALVPIPWILGALLFANGALDRSPPRNFDAAVVGRFSMGGVLPMNQLIVTSWRTEDGVERLNVSRQTYIAFPAGSHVEVRISGGLADIPWVYGVYSQ